MEVSSTFICLFDLPSYDTKVAPALRRYTHDLDPSGVVALLHEAARKPGHAEEDLKHWADAIAPDAGYKPSEQTIHSLCDMLLPAFCIPRMQEIDHFVPWLSGQSEWFADLVDGGEELAGGRLEFSFGTGSLIATRQQIHQFLEELKRATDPPDTLKPDCENLRRLLELADTNSRYTLLKTDLPHGPGTSGAAHERQ